MASPVDRPVLSGHDGLHGGLVTDVSSKAGHLRNDDDHLELLAITGGLNDTGDQRLGDLVFDRIVIDGARDAAIWSVRF